MLNLLTGKFDAGDTVASVFPNTGRLFNAATDPTITALERPSNLRVAVFGDSRTARGILINATTSQFHSRGLLAWARALSRQAFDHDVSDVFGAGGYTSDQVLALLQANIAAVTAGTIVILCGTNDRASPALYTDTQSIGFLTQIMNLILSLGKLVIFLNEMPRGVSNVLAGAQLSYHLSVSRWLTTQSSKPGVFVVDSFGPLVDPLSASASPLVAFPDGLHPDGSEVYTGTAGLVTLLSGLFQQRNLVATSNADLYDATNNVRGILNANPMMTGTTGTVNTPGAGTMSGQLATSYTADLTNGTGLTVTLSKVTTADGKAWQQAAISGTPTSAGSQLRFLTSTSMSSLVAAGDTLEQTGEFQIDTGQTGVSTIEMEMSTSSFTRRDMEIYQTGETYPAVALSGVLRISSAILTVAEASFLKSDFLIKFLQNVAVSATIRCRALSVRKVI